MHELKATNPRKVRLRLMGLFCLMICFLITFNAHGQAPIVADTSATDTLRFVEIIHANSMRQIYIDDSTQLQTLTGLAQIRESGTLMDGDSIIINKRLGTVEVFGHVHVTDVNSVNTYCEYLKYLGNEKMAYLKNNVRLNDGQSELFTNDLTYDLSSGIARYENGGKVVSNRTVLTSNSAEYFGSSHDVIFRNKVRLKDPKYDMKADSLRYNTDFKTAYFISKTNIKTGTGSILTRSGTYDLNTGEAIFLGKPVIKDNGRYISGNRVQFDDRKGVIDINGNGTFVDSASKVMVQGDQIFIDKKSNTFLSTRHPVMVFFENHDSTFITADTLYSAMEIKQRKDSIDGKFSSFADSIRYFQAYRHVRIFNDSLQAVSDSLYYTTADSTFRLIGRPICWNQQTQLTGDTIYLETENKKGKELKVINNAMLINKTPEGLFNQMSGNRMNGYFKDGNLDKVRTKGSPAESIFYPQDEDSAYIGMNRNKGDVIDVFFRDKSIQKVKFINDVTGTLYPMRKIPENMNQLKNFNWQEALRPKNKFEIYQ